MKVSIGIKTIVALSIILGVIIASPLLLKPIYQALFSVEFIQNIFNLFYSTSLIFIIIFLAFYFFGLGFMASINILPSFPIFWIFLQIMAVFSMVVMPAVLPILIYINCYYLPKNKHRKKILMIDFIWLVCVVGGLLFSFGHISDFYGEEVSLFRLWY